MGCATCIKSWSFIFRRYLLRLALGSLAWEILQLPLYTLASDSRPAWIAYAIAHCTLGDVLIGSAAMVAALAICRMNDPANWSRKRVIVVTVFLCVAYTILSERYNLAQGGWTYSPLMPIVPVLKVGLSPLLQWLVVPVVAWWTAKPGKRSA